MDITEITNKVWLISDLLLNIFLIEGKDKALLIDSGWGLDNLSEVVSSLTSLPVILVNTHGHTDHVSGNYQFESAYIHEDDLSMAKEIFTREYRSEFVKRFAPKGLPDYFNTDQWIDIKFDNFIPLNGMKYFDLGDRTVNIIHIPGHTAGSICLLDSKTGFLFSGDSVTEGNLLLNLDESLSLHTYLSSLNKFIDIKDRINYIFPYHPYHGRNKIEPSILEEQKSAIEKIISGESIGSPRNSVLGTGLFSKFNNFTIAYKEDNI